MDDGRCHPWDGDQPLPVFWQAAQEVEDTKAKPLRDPLRRKPAQGPGALARIQLDTLVGMGFSNLATILMAAGASAFLLTLLPFCRS